MGSTAQSALKAGQKIDGFEVSSVTPLPRLRATACRLLHPRSGARVLHLVADDAENLFSISFPTPPPDSTGLPHIMEHAVLGGSQRFPVRDPFFEMLKMSMATFINAMTGPDCTYYPVASNVRADLFNLADVYFDAVFHPLISEEIFMREGHHLAPADGRDAAKGLTVSGIVYNEMKGVFSAPESRLHVCVARQLFPESIYGREAGGDPDAIPGLTFDAFTRFHRRHYHPSNALFVLYGDIPTADYLAFLKPRLAPFERQDTGIAIARQPRWSEPREGADTYPVGRDEPPAERAYLDLSWVVGDAGDPAEMALFHVLNNLLLGHEGAPLKKALIDSKLGQDLLPSGFSDSGIEATFSVGLKGSEPDRAGAFRDLVLSTLRRLADGPFSQDQIDAAFQQAAYHHQEIQSAYPLHLMDRVIAAWSHGLDPLTFVDMGAHLDACRRRCDADPALLGRLVRERLVDNPHRLLFTLRPDPGWQEAHDEKFRQAMEARRAAMAPAALKAVAEQDAELARKGSEPNPPEALARLPQLKISDLPARPRRIPTSVLSLAQRAELLRNDVFANGVNYLQLDFDLTGLPEALWPCLPRYMDAFRKMGTTGRDYAETGRRLAASTGGVDCALHFGTRVDDPSHPVWSLRVGLKALDARAVAALDVLHDLLFSLDPSDTPRLRDLVVQARARYRTDFVRNGTATASRHAARGLTVEGHLSETVAGLPQLGLVGRLLDEMDAGRGDAAARVDEIRRFLLGSSRLTASFTGTDSVFEAVRAALAGWLGALKPAPRGRAGTGFAPFVSPPREGLAAPVQVAYCTCAIPAPHASHADAPLLALGAHLISHDYVLPRVRFKGNAYGAWCGYDSLGRVLSLASYRDPHITETLKVFAGAAHWVRTAPWMEADIHRAIIATAKREEEPIRPAMATGLALHRHLTGQTQEYREKRYAALKAATPASVRRALLQALETGAPRGAVCVLSSRKRLEEASRESPSAPFAIEDVIR